MGGKGGTTINAPEAVDPAQAGGEYLFGQDFTQYQGITDPVLQERLLGAERTYRPQYAALELAEIGTFAQGLEAGPNQERLRLQAQLAGLEAARDLPSGISAKDRNARLRQIAEDNIARNNLYSQSYSGRESAQKRRQQAAAKEAYIENYVAQQTALSELGDGAGEERARQIAQLQTQIEAMPEMTERQAGLFDLLEDSSRRAGALQRESLAAQRADDVAALQQFAPQVVEAYRGADPYSTRLAELSQAQAERAFQRAAGPISDEERRQVEQSVLQRAGMGAQTQADRTAVEMALGRRGLRQQQEQYAAGLGQGAFAQQRALAGDLGTTILGRPSSSINLGSQVLGQAQQGAAGQLGPSLFDMNAGINLAQAQRQDEIGLMGAQAQANAARSSGAMSALGSLGGGLLALCWVAREVYGEENPKWQQFRAWMVSDSPRWFFHLYHRFGERFAKFISNKPRLKNIIRKWMDNRIK